MKMRSWLWIAALAPLAISGALLAGAALFAPAKAERAERPSAARTAFDFAFISIEGAPMPLSAYRGRPMLVVNTASRCGFTGQYRGLQALWERYRDQGLVLVATPSGDFHQELATAAEVKEFCEVTFGLDLPMTEIVHVKGAKAHPFFAWAAQAAGAPTWNFNKYVIDRSGRVVKRFNASAKPAELAPLIESLLADAPPA